jgi:hypothetical protein
MAETPDPFSLVKPATEAVKPLIDVVKTAIDSVVPVPLHPRAGPLVVVGRFYVSMTIILAIVTSTSALIDWKTSPHDPASSIAVLRIGLLASVAVGLVFSIVLIGVLLWKHALYLFNPAELSAEAQAQLAELGQAKGDTEIVRPEQVGPKKNVEPSAVAQTMKTETLPHQPSPADPSK